MPRLIYGRGKVTLETPYNAAFVDALKARIPPQSRSWEPIDKHWLVWEPYVLTARDLVNVYYANVDEDNAELLNESKNYGGAGYQEQRQYRYTWTNHNDFNSGSSNSAGGFNDRTRYYDFTSGQWKERAQSSSSTGSASNGASSDHAVLFVTADAPKEVIDAAYRALARLYHPDINKSPDANGKMERLNLAYARVKK